MKKLIFSNLFAIALFQISAQPVVKTDIAGIGALVSIGHGSGRSGQFVQECGDVRSYERLGRDMDGGDSKQVAEDQLFHFVKD